MDQLSRRRLLAGAGVAGITAGGGCLNSILGGGSGCGAATDFVKSWLNGQFEQAVQYLPYEHTERLNKAESVQFLESLYGMAQEPEFRSVSCKCTESVSATEYKRVQQIPGDLTLGNVRILRLSVTLFNDGREQTKTWYAAVYTVSGQGPYVTPGIGGRAKERLQSLTSQC